MRNLLLSSYILLFGISAAAETVFEAEGLTSRTPVKLYYSYDQASLQGRVIARYKGDCSQVKIPCAKLKVNLIFDVSGLTFDEHTDELVFNNGATHTICAKKNRNGSLKPTSGCEIIFSQDPAANRSTISLIVR